MAVLVGVLVGIALFAVSMPAARRAGRQDGDPATTRLVRWGLLLKLLAAPLYLAVISAVYGGGDYGLYSQQAAAIAHQWRAFHFSAPIPALTGYSTQDNFAAYVAGGLYTLTGVTLLGATLFFTWLAFWGQYLCYRAFRTALPNGDRARYGRLIFLFPSILFWTAPIGKDALIFFGIGVSFWGISRLMVRSRGGFVALALGLALIMVVRPNIALTIFVALVPAFIVGRRPSRRGGAASKVVGIAVLLVIGSLLVPRAEHFLGVKNLSLTAVNNRLKRVATDTSGAGSQNFGTAATSTNTPTVIDDPARIPVDVVTVMFRPFPWEAPTTVTRLAGLESLALLGFTLVSWRRILALLWRLGRLPYAAYAFFYAIVFIATFASVGNYGILARERVQALPAFFVLLAAVPLGRGRRGAVDRPPPSRSDNVRPTVRTDARLRGR